MRHYIKLLLLGLSIVSCQSARSVVPATEAYRTTVGHRQAVVASPTEPVLAAALPPLTTSDEAKAKYAVPQSDLLATAPRVLAPDTTVKQSTAPVLSGKADPTTTVVNVVGAAITAVGIGVMIANSGEAPQTEWGGLSQAISFLGGIIMTLFGLALLFFQGKNGRMRRLREARKAAASPTSGQSPVVAPDPAVPSTQSNYKHKTGLRLMIAGGVVGLLGFLLNGFLLLLLPVAVILLLIGAVFSITGH